MLCPDSGEERTPIVKQTYHGNARWKTFPCHISPSIHSIFLISLCIIFKSICNVEAEVLETWMLHGEGFAFAFGVRMSYEWSFLQFRGGANISKHMRGGDKHFSHTGGTNNFIHVSWGTNTFWTQGKEQNHFGILLEWWLCTPRRSSGTRNTMEETNFSWQYLNRLLPFLQRKTGMKSEDNVCWKLCYLFLCPCITCFSFLTFSPQLVVVVASITQHSWAPNTLNTRDTLSKCSACFRLDVQWTTVVVLTAGGCLGAGEWPAGQVCLAI